MGEGLCPAICERDSSRRNSNNDSKPTIWRPNSVIVHLVLFSVQLCFSGWHVLAKVALNDGVNAIALAMAREVCATFLMFVIARRVDGAVALDPVHAVRFLWMGVASCGNIVGTVLALTYFSPMAFGVMQPSIPVFAMALSHLCGLEQLSNLTCVGVLFSVAGAVWVEVYTATAALADDGKDPALVTGVGLLTLEASEGGMVGGAGGGGGLGGSQGPQWLGSLILLWQCGSMATLIVLQKPMLAVYPPATVTAWYYAVGSALTMIVCLCCGVQPTDFLLTGKWEPWIALLYAVLIGTVYTYNAYSWVLHIVSPTTATAYLTLQPVTTVILSVVFLHATVQGHEVFGGVAIAAGLILTVYAKGLERRGSSNLLRAKQSRELSRVFKTPRRPRFRRIVNGSSNNDTNVGGGGGGDLSNSDTDAAALGFESDQDPLFSGVGRGYGRGVRDRGAGSYDPREAARADGSLRRFLALA